jgi:hypothetical protein
MIIQLSWRARETAYVMENNRNKSIKYEILNFVLI